jgi:hypothetical protein
MKLTGPACTEALSGAEEARRRERAEDNAGGVRVERRVRATTDQVLGDAGLAQDDFTRDAEGDNSQEMASTQRPKFQPF